MAPPMAADTDGTTKFGAVRFTRILVLSFNSAEFLCWKHRLTMRDGTVYESDEVGAPLSDCLPYFTDDERAIILALPRVDESGKGDRS